MCACVCVFICVPVCVCLQIPGFCLSGRLIMMLTPRFMNGLLKSTTRSRLDVIDSGAMAMSASWIEEEYIHIQQNRITFVQIYISHGVAGVYVNSLTDVMMYKSQKKFKQTEDRLLAPHEYQTDHKVNQI